MAGSVLGEKVLRKEDPKFLTTGGVYIDDFTDPRLDRAVHVVFARSSVAHGTINSIDTSEAAGMPGVLAVHTAASLSLEPQPSAFNPRVARTLLASDKVRWVGEPIAAIVAETYEQATDAAQTVVADIDPLPVLIDLEQSLASDTHIYEAAGGNAVFDSVSMGGTPNTGPEFFEGCEVVVNRARHEPACRRARSSRGGAAAARRRATARVAVDPACAGGARPIATAAGVEPGQVRILTP